MRAYVACLHWPSVVCRPIQCFVSHDVRINKCKQISANILSTKAHHWLRYDKKNMDCNICRNQMLDGRTDHLCVSFFHSTKLPNYAHMQIDYGHDISCAGQPTAVNCL